jgi:GTP-binding protein
VATKLDATTDRTKLEELQKFCKKKGVEFHAISAATGEGVKELVRGIADALDKIPKESLEDEGTEVEEIAEVNEVEDSDGAAIVEDLENED